jgi:hypothetical protein
MENWFKPERVDTAINSLKKSVTHYLLIQFNPEEAKNCIPLLHQAFELLLREYFDQVGVDNSSELEMWELIEDYWHWNEKQKETMKWLKDQRNLILHEGEDWEEPKKAKENIGYALNCMEVLYKDLGYILEEDFLPLERDLIIGKDPKWQDLADLLSQAAINYVSTDPEIAVEIANYTADVAFRSFASSWQIEGAYTLPISELKSMLDEIGNEGSSYYEDRRDEGDTYREFPREGFNKSLHDLETHGREGGPEVAALYYAQEIREAVLSYIERALIVVGVYMRDNWDLVVEELERRYPRIEIPNVDSEWWDRDASLLIGKKIFIPLAWGSAAPHWEKADISRLREVVSELCGDIPEDVEIGFRTLFSY